MRTILIATAALLSSTAASAAVLGPVFPAPGGTTVSNSGTLGTGPLTASYSNFDLNASGQLYWGAYSIGLAMDGAINGPGETLSFNAGLSNLAGGVAVYAGSTVVTEFGSPINVATRYTLSLTDLSNNAIAFTTTSTALGIAGAVFPLLEIGAGFKVVQTLTANNVAYQTFFDTAPGKSPTAGQLQTSISRGFYYTDAATQSVPEPVTWAMMVVGFGAIGVAMRRRQRMIVAFA